MRLYLVRHGTAEPHPPEGPPEEKRALVPRGWAQCAKLAPLLRQLGPRFDRIATSPLRRARQTAEEIARLIDHPDPVELESGLLPETPVEEAVASLMERDERRLIAVGHEPLLSAMVAHLVGAPGLRLDLRKGGLVEMVVPDPRHPRATLLGVLRPGHLA